MRVAQRLLLCMATIAVVAGCTTCGGGQPQIVTPPAVTRPSFDRGLAFSTLQQQCDFGSRVPGSTAHAQCGRWLVSQLKTLAGEANVVVQDFSSRTPMGGPYDFQNIVAAFGRDVAGTPLLLGAHWDSRPVADNDPETANRDQPVMGANDGASGVAVLLELARLLTDHVPVRPIYIALFDAEDSGRGGNTAFPYMGFCIGSNYLASNWLASLPRPAEMILLDIVGTDQRRNPRLQEEGVVGAPEFKLETNSLNAAPTLVNAIWGAAEKLGHTAFRRETGGAMIDDHKPFIDHGIPGVDIIHAMPAEWHTIDDTPANCSAETLYQVGDTLVEVIWGS